MPILNQREEIILEEEQRRLEARQWAESKARERLSIEVNLSCSRKNSQIKMLIYSANCAGKMKFSKKKISVSSSQSNSSHDCPLCPPSKL